MTFMFRAVSIGIVLIGVAGSTTAAEDPFVAVASVFERRCLGCHNTDDRKGGLSLASRDDALTGGESGFAIVPGDPSASYLLDLVTPHDGRAEMPKEAEPLDEAEIDAIRAWIVAGATWPDGRTLDTAQVADTDWWSLRPPVKPPVPAVASTDVMRVRNPIDAFVLTKLHENGLSFSPEADRRMLIRRLSFDLTGLPPSPAEVEAFVASDDPLAYERLVDLLLASPHYGERWARHWLDVAHYGDSHGYDKDKPRPNAWPYRDYVVRAFNDDKPYPRFLREQIAGDVLWPDSADGVIATGFLAAGPWDFISHVEVPESKIDGQIARSLDRDDVVRSVFETFASTTVGCARCHNHLFDPITQEDYYAVQAVFAAIDRADRPYDSDPAIRRRRQELLTFRDRATASQAITKVAFDTAVGSALKESRRAFEMLAREHPPRPEFGYHSAIASQSNVAKWVQVDLGRPIAIHEVVLVGCYDEFAGIGAGFGYPERFRIEVSNDPAFRDGVVTIADRTVSDQPNPGVLPQRFPAAGTTARYVRLTATKLAVRQNDFIFALAELQVITADETSAAAVKVTSLDSIDAPPRWWKENLADGVWFGSETAAGFDERLAVLHEDRQAALARIAESKEIQTLADAEARLADLDEQLAALPPAKLVYAAATTFERQGNFIPTNGNPRPIHLLRRGNVRTPGDAVGPGAIEAIDGLAGRFELPSDHTEGDRRTALADWLAHRGNPLTWRSIVNRIWLYHFGRGLVDTPNDFGRMGESPSHPKLLDWLAVEFRDSGGSIKHLHRLIVTSTAYRQSSGISDFGSPTAISTAINPLSIDADNRLYWRMNRRRLEAEEVRDAVLATAGLLDLRMYGPAYQDFTIDKPEHSPHYLYDRHDPADRSTHRRAIYRFIVRSQPQPFLSTLDGADSSMSVDKRNETVTPLQSLALLNNPFMVEMSRRFSERVAGEAGDLESQVETAFRIALGRDPQPFEREKLSEYAKRHGMANACRIILNLNEFVYVD
ncbi:MAG: DUF1553 domain-containing protein [Planctomycetaceae bacterium]